MRNFSFILKSCYLQWHWCYSSVAKTHAEPTQPHPDITATLGYQPFCIEYRGTMATLGGCITGLTDYVQGRDICVTPGVTPKWPPVVIGVGLGDCRNYVASDEFSTLDIYLSWPSFTEGSVILSSILLPQFSVPLKFWYGGGPKLKGWLFSKPLWKILFTITKHEKYIFWEVWTRIKILRIHGDLNFRMKVYQNSRGPN